MERVLYWLARGVIALIQSLPLVRVAKLGRFGGWLAYHLDARHRKVSLGNIAQALGPNLSLEEIRKIALENFKRIGENFASAVKTAGMDTADLAPHLCFDPGENDWNEVIKQGSFVVAIGHFGNFELFARFGQVVPSFRTATTYRGLNQESLNKLLQELRAKSGCMFFDRRFEADALKHAMASQQIVLGLLADQNAGNKGLRLPFFGRDCSTSSAPAVFALRYGVPLYTGICYRVELARWRLEMGAAIPTHVDGRPRAVAAIMSDVNAAFEKAVRRDPANWFWVHNRWKNPGRPT